MANQNEPHPTPRVAHETVEQPPVDATNPTYALAQALARLGLEKKAADVVLLDVRGLASYAEFFVVMTADSEPQLLAIADHLEAEMKKRGERALGVEGLRAGQWVLIDYGDVVAHVFYRDARAFYDIEGLWADARREHFTDGAPAQADLEG